MHSSQNHAVGGRRRPYAAWGAPTYTVSVPIIDEIFNLILWLYYAISRRPRSRRTRRSQAIDSVSRHRSRTRPRRRSCARTREAAQDERSVVTASERRPFTL